MELNWIEITSIIMQRDFLKCWKLLVVGKLLLVDSHRQILAERYIPLAQYWSALSYFKESTYINIYYYYEHGYFVTISHMHWIYIRFFLNPEIIALGFQ